MRFSVECSTHVISPSGNESVVGGLAVALQDTVRAGIETFDEACRTWGAVRSGDTPNSGRELRPDASPGWSVRSTDATGICVQGRPDTRAVDDPRCFQEPGTSSSPKSRAPAAPSESSSIIRSASRTMSVATTPFPPSERFHTGHSFSLLMGRVGPNGTCQS